jgi:uncharacterized protein involved in exopolysaccharide biosynthesis
MSGPASENQDETNQAAEGPGTSPPGNGASKSDRSGYGHPPREDEVSLLDILLVLARHKTLIVRSVLVFTLLGVTYALLAPEEFTSEARVVREAQQDGELPGGISAGALSGFGISLGGASSGLTPQAFPDVLQSREVKIAVVRDTFYFPDVDLRTTFVEYINRPPGLLEVVLNYTIKLPLTLKDHLSGLISKSPQAPTSPREKGRAMLSKEEEDAVKAISEMVYTTLNEETGLMTITVTTGDPRLASDLTQSFVEYLTQRVREIRTKKIRERLNFVNERFRVAENELVAAEERLARFLERNQNPTTATLQFQRDRLQRQVRFKEQLYSELQSQLTQTRLDLQRQQPVVTVVEEPVPPRERSAPKRTLIVILCLIFGGMFGIGGAFLRSYLNASQQDTDERRKLEEVREALGLFENGVSLWRMIGLTKKEDSSST